MSALQTKLAIRSGGHSPNPGRSSINDPGLLEYEGIWGHIDILVVAVRSLSRRWKVKILLAGPSPTSPMKAKIIISPISNRTEATPEAVVVGLLADFIAS